MSVLMVQYGLDGISDWGVHFTGLVVCLEDMLHLLLLNEGIQKGSDL